MLTHRSCKQYSQSHLGWHLRMLFQSSKLKARSSLFTESSKLKRLFSLKRGKRDDRALSFELSQMSPQVGLAVICHIVGIVTVRPCKIRDRKMYTSAKWLKSSWGLMTTQVIVKSWGYCTLVPYLRSRCDDLGSTRAMLTGQFWFSHFRKSIFWWSRAKTTYPNGEITLNYLLLSGSKYSQRCFPYSLNCTNSRLWILPEGEPSARIFEFLRGFPPTWEGGTHPKKGKKIEYF